MNELEFLCYYQYRRKKILEEKYEKKITDLYLICVHPDNPYQTYDRIKVPVLEKEMDDLFAFRKSQIHP